MIWIMIALCIGFFACYIIIRMLAPHQPQSWEDIFVTFGIGYTLMISIVFGIAMIVISVYVTKKLVDERYKYLEQAKNILDETRQRKEYVDGRL